MKPGGWWRAGVALVLVALISCATAGCSGSGGDEVDDDRSVSLPAPPSTPPPTDEEARRAATELVACAREAGSQATTMREVLEDILDGEVSSELMTCMNDNPPRSSSPEQLEQLMDEDLSGAGTGS